MTARNKLSLGTQIAAVVLYACIAHIVSAETLSDVHEGKIQKLVLSGPEAFSIAHMTALSKRPGVLNTVLLVSAFFSRDDAYLLNKSNTDNATFSDWESRFRIAMKNRPLRMLELTSLGADAVVRSVDEGRVSKTIIRGNDPTVFEVAGRRCELLSTSVYKLPRPLHPEEDVLILEIYLRADKLPAVKDAVLITKYIQARFQHSAVRVHVRADAWFIEDFRFPLWFPFEPNPSPPSLAKYRSGGEIFCSVERKNPQCYQSPVANAN